MNRDHRLTRRTASRMLDNPGAATGDPVGRLLAAASSPTGASVPGEDVALAQFQAHTSRAMSATPEGVTPMVSKRSKITAPIAALVAAGAVVATGGLAFAASQGNVHVPFTGHDNRSANAPAAKATANPGHSKPTATATTSPTGSATPKVHPTASPSPSLRGLCKAFQAGATQDGKTNPAFSALTKAAGSQANIATFCVTLLATPKSTAQPTHPAKPTQAANPSHPPKPTKPAKPSRVAKPTKPATGTTATP